MTFKQARKATMMAQCGRIGLAVVPGKYAENYHIVYQCSDGKFRTWYTMPHAANAWEAFRAEVASADSEFIAALRSSVR